MEMKKKETQWKTKVIRMNKTKMMNDMKRKMKTRKKIVRNMRTRRG